MIFVQWIANALNPAGTGSTPLVLAAANSQWATVQAMLAAGADPNRRSSSPADAPGALHLAVAAGQLELVKELLAAGADPNARSSSGSPLELAAARSNAPMVAALLAAGADASASARQGLTPLFMVGACRLPAAAAAAACCACCCVHAEAIHQGSCTQHACCKQRRPCKPR